MNYISKENLFNLLDGLKNDYEVYVPVKKGEHRFYRRYEEAKAEAVIGEVRAFEPLKAFFNRAREVVAEGFKPEAPHSQDKPVAVFACEIELM